MATGEATASLVEGDAGFASRGVQDFVVRSGPWAQPGLMAVSPGRGLGLLRAVRFSQAAFLTRLFSGHGAHCGCGTKSAKHPVRGSPLPGRANCTLERSVT